MSSENFKIEMPFGPPPVLPELVKQFEEYLTKPEKLPLHNNENDFRFWNREIDLNSLYDSELSPALTTLRIKQNFNTDESLQFDEVPIEGIGETSKNSMSFSRPPGRVTDDILGSTSNCPFWPGGLDPPVIPQIEDADINLDSDLLSHAPGLSTAVDFSSASNTSTDLVESEKCLDSINFQNIMEDFGLSSVLTDKQSKDHVNVDIFSHELEKMVIPKEVSLPVLKISSYTPKTKTKTEWAELLDTTQLIVNFNEKIPDPAVQFPFELDTFQKLAILRLENHEHIFVAAHTSAGKTVVAEYAIGLSLKHCTKTIYTSPIKALSNQKYRDFKNKFGEVGLITGDFQVNQQAPCLIMTTEILRSMLYAGSDIIRDVEYVIFDEVHYINDSERGHVWEEIMIMLPDTVCIVMLSATVPNVLEFADWVGSTKKAKVFVVSTYKRPVPLQHFLYTGAGGKNDNLFLIKDAEGPFILDGYAKAQSSLKTEKVDVKIKVGKNKIVKYKPLESTSEKHYWIGFAKFLKKCDKLPAVAFTLSRSKCDRNAEYLMSIDLTTQAEKDYISYNFKSAINTLKKEDQSLPQIVKMEQLLSRGIAVHHSGILPILKEIVEILFQKSLVKFLFATETFAMGVNMPAKTVAFDSIKKYDGTGTRVLEPAEYIQMAGRAGRRGQDDVGTVIILCKHSVEKVEALKNMMTGPPTRLQSQFRMTYSMILNLLRVKRMRVEEIMSHSFKEMHSRRKMKMYEKELEELSKDSGHNEVINKPFYYKLAHFYEAAADYIETWDSYGVKLFYNPKVQKKLVPGTFIIISHEEHINKLALILRVNSKREGVDYKVLILCDAEEEEKAKEPNSFYRMVGLARKSIYVPGAQSKDLLLTVGVQSIKEITKFSLNTEFDLVLKDYEERQLPRFRDKPPSERYIRATSTLSDRSYSIQTNGGMSGPNFISLNDFKINDLELVQLMAELISLKKAVQSCNLESEVPDFETQFKEVFIYLQKEDRKKDLEHKISYESLSLYPDYEKRVEVLKALEYIDNEDMIQMKGKVACGMGSHELIITELIFQNSLSKFEPAEIAALLSCLIFQVNLEEGTKSELSDRLEEGIDIIEKVYIKIKEEERQTGFTDEMDSLNFGLVPAVYEWAHGKPFADIMSLVDGQVQEGIIVRCIQQLNEILRDIKDAAKLFGDQALKVKMEEASDAIKRDIVFAASLYTQ